jgi:hypothetical protein
LSRQKKLQKPGQISKAISMNPEHEEKTMQTHKQNHLEAQNVIANGLSICLSTLTHTFFSSKLFFSNQRHGKQLSSLPRQFHR